jgi:NAD(P)H-dependent FMN reductase
MIEVIAGTDRPNSNTIKVAQLLAEDYRALNTPVDILDLSKLDLKDAQGAAYKGAKGSFLDGVERVTRADGLVMVVPEYNGSFPGMLKLFIDYWRYPESFEARPVAFVGLGARWGGVRPVEQLQQVLGFRNAYIFPHRVFLPNVKDALKNGKVADPMLNDLLKTQARDFLKFIRALKDEKLDANSRLDPQRPPGGHEVRGAGRTSSSRRRRPLRVGK